MRITFHGAARQVTGSCHLVECAGSRVLIDCGLNQGGSGAARANEASFDFDPASIDILLTTHAHLDHCGRIPLLEKRGFRGEIITTAATWDLIRLVLLDAAHIQEEEALRATRRRARKPRAGRVEPLYDSLDALDSLSRFGRTARYDEPIDVAPGIRATFIDAGHILGSACILLELEESGRRVRVLFSGDLGSSGRPILRDPTPPPHADVVVMETTYGDRLHRPLADSIEEFCGAVTDTIGGGGNVVIPTFALERTQELLFVLREGEASGRLPRGLQVFLDSPMAISATGIFRRHPDCYDAETAKLFAEGRDPFSLPGMHFTRETADSMAINSISGGAVIMAGSGMCTGGRVRHHLKHNLWRQNCSVIFVGFAASGTLARKIIDGADSVPLFGNHVAVRARVHTINGFSGHADRDELLAWHRQVAPQTTFLVHGEEAAMRAFARSLGETSVELPELHQAFEL